MFWIGKLTNAFKHAFVNRKEGKIEVVRDKGTTFKIEFTLPTE